MCIYIFVVRTKERKNVSIDCSFYSFFCPEQKESKANDNPNQPMTTGSDFCSLVGVGRSSLLEQSVD